MAQNVQNAILKNNNIMLTNNTNAPDKDGETPIHWAAQNGHTEIVKI